MKGHFAVIFICLFTFLYLAYANSHTSHSSYYVTTLTNDARDSKQTAFEEIDDNVRYNNISIHTRFIKLARNSGLSQTISIVLSSPPYKRAAGNRDEAIHLSKFIEKRKEVFKKLYWNRKLTSNDITECSQVFCSN